MLLPAEIEAASYIDSLYCFVDVYNRMAVFHFALITYPPVAQPTEEQCLTSIHSRLLTLSKDLIRHYGISA